jgi:hypothetical protein
MRNALRPGRQSSISSRGAASRLGTRSALAGIAALLALPVSARATVIFDPGGDVWRAPDPTLNTLRALGTDTVRLRVAYSDHPRLGLLDYVVHGARARGLQVLLTPIGPAPSVTAYAKFVGRLGRRYREVHDWAIYNEPDLPQLFPLPGQGGWNPTHPAPPSNPGILPTDPHPPPTDPHPPPPVGLPPAPPLPISARPAPAATRPYHVGRLYRAVFLASQRALLAGGHPRDQVLIGETSPAVSPTFIRAVLRGRPLVAKGWAHHPYITGPTPASRSIHFGPGDVPRLHRMLRPARGPTLPIYVTEFGVRASQGPSMMLESARLLHGYPYVRSFAQYTLSDDSFGTGLLRKDGSAKPAFWTFARIARLFSDRARSPAR